ncbi:MAG: M20 family metallopeptidase [Intrasporangium sp.]|uniref:M20 metallopeptidase family protein n=1 Tax=Intrasporangium sp. TaxID=1925024 RepID=UPI0026481C7E|nr:M20 family metallopeptidase [Intrasporangium sp.]MDN5796500.1 M20 family metallopeptidase [Intrasporangium sp.]
MDLRDDARTMQPDLVELRRQFHRDPEVGLQLPRTQDRVLQALEGLPLEISTGTSTTSVTAVLRGGQRNESGTTTVLLRGDMDGLPVQEETGLEFASSNGAMHACGHDLHTTNLIGAARLLSRHRESLLGDVVFMFQPGEEGCDGAGAMIAEGVLDAAGKRADYAYAMHVFSAQMPTGLFVCRPGPMLSASYCLDITVQGAGGHGSMPYAAHDPVTAAAEIVLALQTMITRGINMFDPVVLTVGIFQAGTARNVIPDTARLEATVRCFTPAAEARLEELIPRVVNGVAASHGVTAEIDFHNQYPPTVNNPDEVAFAAEVIADVLGQQRYAPLDQPISGSEDFSRVLAEVPGAFIGVGACLPDVDPATAPMNHSSRAQFDDAVLSDCVAGYAALAVHRLEQASTEGAIS